MKIPFEKWHGLGNDIIIVDGFGDPNLIDALTHHVKHMANRRLGIGADQICLITPAKEHSLGLRIFNQDGSQAYNCGNGLRCVVSYWTRQKREKLVNMWLEKATLSVTGRALGDAITIELPIINCTDETKNLVNLMPTYKGLKAIMEADVGNRHRVIIIDGDDDQHLWKHWLSHHLPTHWQAINTHLLISHEDFNDCYMTLFSHERGCGITPACGSGAAAAMMAMQQYQGKNQLTLRYPNGHLQMKYKTSMIEQTGPAQYVFSGHWMA